MSVAHLLGKIKAATYLRFGLLLCSFLFGLIKYIHRMLRVNSLTTRCDNDTTSQGDNSISAIEQKVVKIFNL